MNKLYTVEITYTVTLQVEAETPQGAMLLAASDGPEEEVYSALDSGTGKVNMKVVGEQELEAN